jgi:hypothetical protein
LIVFSINFLGLLMIIMNRRVREFLMLYSEKYSRLVWWYRNSGSFSNQPWFGSIILSLVELGKRLSKVDHTTCGRKKSRRCMNACTGIMFSMMREYSHILKENGFRFDQLVQKLYGFDRRMALLLCNIAFDIVLDQRFKHLLAIASQCDLDLWSVFFGKVKPSPFTFPKNLSFYLRFFSAQCICAQSNPRKRLLTNSGFANILIRKFGILQIFKNRKCLFKCI